MSTAHIEDAAPGVKSAREELEAYDWIFENLAHDPAMGWLHDAHWRYYDAALAEARKSIPVLSVEDAVRAVAVAQCYEDFVSRDPEASEVDLADAEVLTEIAKEQRDLAYEAERNKADLIVRRRRGKVRSVPIIDPPKSKSERFRELWPPERQRKATGAAYDEMMRDYWEIAGEPDSYVDLRDASPDDPHHQRRKHAKRRRVLGGRRHIAKPPALQVPPDCIGVQ